MSFNSVQCLVTLLVFLCVLFVTDSCFIRNCPQGGKRSMGSEATKQCMRCGPGNRGQCVGPKICCGESFGCYMGTEETSVCGQENDSTTPCTVRGEPCGSRQLGTCVANGFCCDSEACSSNSRCMAMQESKKSQSSKEELLNLIQRLLKSKNYD